jgi:hypothetical protein
VQSPEEEQYLSMLLSMINSLMKTMVAGNPYDSHMIKQKDFC